MFWMQKENRYYEAATQQKKKKSNRVFWRLLDGEVTLNRVSENFSVFGLSAISNQKKKKFGDFVLRSEH